MRRIMVRPWSPQDVTSYSYTHSYTPTRRLPLTERHAIYRVYSPNDRSTCARQGAALSKAWTRGQTWFPRTGQTTWTRRKVSDFRFQESGLHPRPLKHPRVFRCKQPPCSSDDLRRKRACTGSYSDPRLPPACNAGSTEAFSVKKRSVVPAHTRNTPSFPRYRYRNRNRTAEGAEHAEGPILGKRVQVSDFRFQVSAKRIAPTSAKNIHALTDANNHPVVPTIYAGSAHAQDHIPTLVSLRRVTPDLQKHFP